MTEPTLQQPVSQCAACSAKGYTAGRCPLPAIGRGRAWLQEHEYLLTVNRLAVMWALLDLGVRHHTVGRVYAVQAVIAKMTGLTQPGVGKILKWLREHGWIRLTEKADGLRHVAAKYHVLPHVTSWDFDGSQSDRDDIRPPRSGEAEFYEEPTGTYGTQGSVTKDELRPSSEEPLVPGFLVKLRGNTAEFSEDLVPVPRKTWYCLDHDLEIHEPGNPDSWMDQASHAARFEEFIESCWRGPWVVG